MLCWYFNVISSKLYVCTVISVPVYLHIIPIWLLRYMFIYGYIQIFSDTFYMHLISQCNYSVPKAPVRSTWIRAQTMIPRGPG